MQDATGAHQRTKKSKTVLLLSTIVAIFWYIGWTMDVYHYAAGGAIFEILWLPMIALLFVLPIVSLYFLFKERFNKKSLYLYSLLILLVSILVAYIQNTF